MFPATGDLHLCQRQKLIFRHKRENEMKTFLGFVHNGTKVEPNETHLALLGKEEEEEAEKQSSKELPPPFFHLSLH